MTDNQRMERQTELIGFLQKKVSVRTTIKNFLWIFASFSASLIGSSWKASSWLSQLNNRLEKIEARELLLETKVDNIEKIFFKPVDVDKKQSYEIHHITPFASDNIRTVRYNNFAKMLPETARKNSNG